MDAAQGTGPHLEPPRGGRDRFRLSACRATGTTSSQRRAGTSRCIPGSAASPRRASTTTALRPRTRNRVSGPSARFPPRTPISSSGSASTRARAMRPATTRPTRRSLRRRTSTSSSASATTSTSTTTTTGPRDESTRPEPTTTATSRRSPSTARSTASTRATRTSRTCTQASLCRHLGRPRGRGQLRRHAPRLGLDRSRPLREQQQLRRGGSRSASGERTATRPSSRRCRGSSSPRTQTASTGHSASGRWPSSS